MKEMTDLERELEDCTFQPKLWTDSKRTPDRSMNRDQSNDKLATSSLFERNMKWKYLRDNSNKFYLMRICRD